MNDTSVANSPEDLKATCAALRHQLNTVLALVFIVSATLTVFFMRQATDARKQRDAIQNVVTEYNQNGVPALNEFTAKLREYAKTHPDVVPILTKYGVLQINNPAAPANPAAARR